MTVADRIRSIVATLPEGASVTLSVESLRGWLDGDDGLSLSDDLSVSDVAAKFGRAESTVRNWCAQGLLPGAYRVNGREWMVPLSAVRAFKGARKERPLPGASATEAYDLGAWRKAS